MKEKKREELRGRRREIEKTELKNGSVKNSQLEN